MKLEELIIFSSSPLVVSEVALVLHFDLRGCHRVTSFGSLIHGRDLQEAQLRQHHGP